LGFWDLGCFHYLGHRIFSDPLFACWGMCEERGNWGFLSVLTLLVKGNDCSLLGCWEIVRKKNKFGLFESLFFSALFLAVYNVRKELAFT
jgi:hypothetical protein